MTPKGRRRGRTIPAFIACFYAGIAVGWWIHAAVAPEAPATAVHSRPEATTGEREVPLKPDTTSEETMIGADPVSELRRRNLRLPIGQASIEKMEGGFAERRDGGSRGHEAVDILAPRHTPIRAVDDGTIARLLVNNAGGTTIYQFDPHGRYCYYYAHLERYADGLREGMHVSKGDVIGHVGTSGNAPPGTPHLHFAIFQLMNEQRWWDGRPLDPYQVFKR